MNAPLLQVRDLCIGFADAAAIVAGLDLDVAGGEIVGLVGPSGVGKSLIARALIGLLPMTAQVRSGDVRFAGSRLSTAADFARVRGSGIAYVFQDAASSLHPLRSVDAQMRECLQVHAPQLDGSSVRRRIGAALDEVGLGDQRRWLDARPHQLSGGQRQRVMLALTLLPQPQLLIADEPTSALDPVLGKRICDLLADSARRRGMGLLLISHDRPRVAEYCQRVYRLVDGRAELLQGAETGLPITNRQPPVRRLPPGDGSPLLAARDLSLRHATGFRLPWQKREPPQLSSVEFTLWPGQRIGVVGSSGCGKSTLARGLLGLMPALEGQVQWFGRALDRLDRATLRRWRPRVQLVFQDPYRSLDPMQRIDAMLVEAFGCARKPPPREQRLQAARDMLLDIGLDASALTRYPTQFSGGQRQRLAIARALASAPEVLVCDEATSALDHDAQAQILVLLDRLVCARGLALLFISHDLDVVAWLCDALMVLDRGRVVEAGSSAALLHAPASDALRSLIDARPRRPLEIP